MFFKHAAMRITAGILCLSALAAPALALTGTINTGSSNLNLRSQANTGSSVLTKIPGGSSVEVLSTAENGWYQISFSGMTGYVAAQYVDLKEEIAQPAPAENTPAENTASGGIRIGRVTESGLNVRTGPGTDHGRCGTLYVGQEVEILESVDGWYHIFCNGSTGYVSSQYVEVAGQANAAPLASPAPAAQPEAAQPAETEETLYARVTVSGLNVRTGPDTTYDKCGKLYAGKVVEILESVDGWYRIEEGYISADYVSVVDESALNSSDIASQAVALALTYVGYPYVYGGSSPSGFDCSGFTSYIYRQFGINLSRSSSAQLNNGTPVSMSELLPGDLVLFSKAHNGRVSHVGMYIGDGQFVHASTYGVGVIVSNMSDAYYTTGFVGGRRVA